MAEHIFKLPDIGEGIAEAELAEWRVKVGDIIREDDVICEITTDKATVEIPASVSGTVLWLGCAPGDTVAIGSDLIGIDSEAAEEEDAEEQDAQQDAPPPADTAAPSPDPGDKPLAAPAVRARARSMGIDLAQVHGTGPKGRVLHEDLDGLAAPAASPRRSGQQEIRVTGVRRQIAERMALSKSRIPHFSIIEEVDVDALEDLRAQLNQQHGAARGKLTVLPFVLRALAQVIARHPEVNSHYDDEAGVITRHAALHCGIATQTDSGLMVPVLRHAEALDLWQAARDIRRLSEAARGRTAAPSDLAGSTLTITSLGPLGALATTPIINHPEVAIIGINRIAVRPVWQHGAFVPRRMMNLSCSFDHRVVDGFVAAEFVAQMKTLLEAPALLFMEARDD
ncbi:dihydrolipoamide acetyltransferase family protein [Roseovarius dicentrarchi]|uniref:dihydrolipoamide acetyltransferase family protein n=1 Tax=Roseovarius dicentrarchi TaxID=2250573 RepID=UPI000DE97060|nr:dihydrolipoamide acetyltransferase family protein [Roseovarius dicentrarchi]